MNNISEQLLQAMDILTDEKVSKLQYDKTIQATIYRIEDIDKGEYKVKYNGNIFSAYAIDLSTTYKVDDKVYVTVPEGNFSNRKLITAVASSQSLNSALLSLLQNSIFEISPDLNALYGGIYDSNRAWGVVASLPVPQPMSLEYIYQGPNNFVTNEYHKMFLVYGSKYEYIQISAMFLTQFHTLMTKGNYGIEITFYSQDGEVKYSLDLNSFNGDPYRFLVYSPQSMVLKVLKNYLLGLKSIRLFLTGFDPDHFIVDGEITGKENLTIPNIFVKNITMKYVDIVDLNDTTYYLLIATPKGIVLNSHISSLDLKGRLIFLGKDIMDKQSCVCQWYERDLGVVVDSDDYSKDAGPGWRAIDGEFNLLHVLLTDVFFKQLYKIVVWYNDKVKTVAEIEVFNGNQNYDFAIKLITELEDIKLYLVNNLDNEVLFGDWYLSLPDGKYDIVNNGKNTSSIVVTPYLEYESMVFYCSVRNSSGRYLGTLEYTIVNSNSEEDIFITFIGQDVYKYDALGSISVNLINQEHTLEGLVAWKEGFGVTHYDLYWLIEDENGNLVQIPNNSTQAISPKYSMLSGLWVDTSNILHYHISRSYDINLIKNTLTLKVVTVKDDVYYFNKEIVFVKDGNQGTNGTSYTVTIRPYNTVTNANGFYPLIISNSGSSTLLLYCDVYRDGELINNGNFGYTFRYEWTCNKNLKFVVNNSLKQVSILGYSTQATPSSSTNSSDFEAYVKVKVTINDKGRDSVLYYTYPVDMIIAKSVSQNIIAAASNNVNISDIPSYIMYSSSGYYPSYNNNSIHFLYNNIDYTSGIKSLNTNLIELKDRNTNFYIYPVNSFIYLNIKDNNSSNIGVLGMRTPEGYDILHSVVMYLNTYGNEAINGWDGEALAIDEANGQYIFAPLVGAGRKDSANKFTGVVMGEDSGLNKIGLYGYQSGETTFGLMSDGKAFFGAKSGGGLIVIDGKTATISGGDGGNNEKGMTITLADLGNNVSSSTEAIKLGGGVFKLTYDGTIYAARGYIGCNKNGRGGWEITADRLHSNSGNTYVALDSASYEEEPMAIWAGSSNSAYAPFSVSKKGEFKANSATISGTISGSTITGSTISGTTLEGNTITGNTILGNTIIGGTISSSNISGSTISGGIISGGLVTGGSISGATISGGSITIGNNFNVDSTGKLTCSSADITGEINATTLRVYQVTIAGDRNFTGNYGYFGQVGGDEEGHSTYNIGVSSNPGSSIILKSAYNIRLTPALKTYLDTYTKFRGKVDFTEAEVIGL